MPILLRDIKAGYMVREFRGKVNDLLLVDDLKLFGKTVQELDSLEQTVRFVSSDLGVQF